MNEALGNVVLITIAILAVLAELKITQKFKKKMNTPLKKVRVHGPFIKDDEDYEYLYESYKNMSDRDFRIEKLKVKSKNFYKDILEQLIDTLSKLVIGIIVALMAYTAVATSTMLNNISNNEEFKKANHVAWSDGIVDGFETFVSGISNYQNIILIFFSIFIMAAIRILFVMIRKELHKKHLTIIEEIEKEKNQK